MPMFFKHGLSGTQFLAWRLSQLMTEAVMKRSWICLRFLMVLGGPGFAQAGKAEPAFYIVLNSLTNTCRVAVSLTGFLRPTRQTSPLPATPFTGHEPKP